MNEAHRLRDGGLNAVLGVEVELDPALGAARAEVVLDGATNLSLSQESSVDKLVEERLFHRHYSSSKFIITKKACS